MSSQLKGGVRSKTPYKKGDEKMMDKKPFVRYKLDEEKAQETDLILNVRLSREEQDLLAEAKAFIKQPKNSTALKQLAKIGAVIVLQDQKINMILDIIQNNNRRKERLGIPDSDLQKVKRLTNVEQKTP
jgi:hypothetical protein